MSPYINLSAGWGHFYAEVTQQLRSCESYNRNEQTLQYQSHDNIANFCLLHREMKISTDDQHHFFLNNKIK